MKGEIIRDKKRRRLSEWTLRISTKNFKEELADMILQEKEKEGNITA